MFRYPHMSAQSPRFRVFLARGWARRLVPGLAFFLAMVAAGCSPDPAPGVIVHLFEWRWDDVAAECEQFLGPAGYAAVQVSPPSENHIVPGRPWWERYQPVSYRLETRSGDRADFADMVSRCAAVGVDIYVDAVINHMADADLEHTEFDFTGRGTAGSTFGPYDYPGLWDYDDFNHCGLTPDDNIHDWDDMDQVWNCELVDLADLAISKPDVQERIVDYLTDLRGLGVSGFRVDAAKHMQPDDLHAIMEQVGDPGYLYLEVKTGGRQPDWVQSYQKTGALTEFSFGEALGEVLREHPMEALLPGGHMWTSREYTPADNAVFFVDNHDNQRGHGGGEGILTYKDGRLYALAQAFALSWPYGRPRVMSSYAFESDFTGPPMEPDESTRRVHLSNGSDAEGVDCGLGRWVCEHRWPAISGMVAFHNAVAAAPEVTRIQVRGSDVLAYGRGDLGFVALNRSDVAYEGTFRTGLPEGTYCNRTAGPSHADLRQADPEQAERAKAGVRGRAEACEEIRVDAKGMLTTTLPPLAALAIDVDSRRTHGQVGR